MLENILISDCFDTTVRKWLLNFGLKKLRKVMEKVMESHGILYD